MKQISYTHEDADLLARTIFGEARGEYHKVGINALVAIGNVVLNRTSIGGFFGNSIAEVCKKPWQFACWNAGDPNLPIISKANKADFLFEVCLGVASALLQGKWPDLTKGSDHYHSRDVRPHWAKNVTPRLKLGSHVFYKLQS
jgi:spore germination cell wall hydrolase CwlJ-like protein